MPLAHVLAATLLLLSPLRILHAQAALPPAQPLAPMTSQQIDDEARRASELSHQSKLLDSLPLFEDLNLRRPNNCIYMEGLAMALIAHSGTLSAHDQQVADDKRALQLFVDARAAGDQSDLSQVMIEKLTNALNSPVETETGPLPPGRASYKAAELLFDRGDLEGALRSYRQSWEEDPKFYFAPLYAGDSEYKLGRFDEAGVWYARAIAIDPDHETAHRYWGDCLMKAGKPQQAKRQYILALIADPYSKAPRLSLRSWAAAAQYRYLQPPISIPPPAKVGQNGGFTVEVDPAKLDDPIQTAWLGYPMQTMAWRGGRFAQQYPNEKVYRHSLAEQVEGLHGFLTVVRKLKIPEAKYDATTRTLIALEKDNMLECWVLLDHADQGIAQDYLAYRAAHRDLLQAYIEKYDLHPA